MDIAAVSMALSSARLNSEVGVAVLSKAMDSNESMGEGIVSMIDKQSMEHSVNPNIGSNFDTYA